MNLNPTPEANADVLTLRQLEDEVNHLTALLNASALVASSLDLDTVLRELVHQAALVLRAKGASLLLLDEERDELVFRVAYGERGADLLDRRFPKHAGIAGNVIAGGEAILIADAHADPRHFSQFDDELGFSTGSLMAVPVQVRGRVLGVLEVLNPAAQSPFTPDDLALLEAFAGQAGLAMENARQHSVLLRQLMLVMEGMQDGLLVLNESGEVQLINPAARGLLGLAAQADVTRADLQRVASTPPLLEVLARAQAAELTLDGTTAAPRVLRVVPSLLRAGTSDRSGTVVVMHDLTRLREVERLKSELITRVSHELRTPVASVQGAAQLLGAGTVDPVSGEGRKFFDIIQRNADRLAALVTNIVDLAQVGIGSLEVTPEPCALSAVLSRAVDAHQADIEAAGLRLALHVAADVSDVWADPVRIEQVLHHLLDNARKFTPAGGRIDVRADTDAEWVVVRVSDTGPGIRGGDRDRAFEAFEQLTDPKRDKPAGTGLGLPIARGIVEASGGRMWFDDAPSDTGATVAFTLPRSRPRA